MTSLSIMMRAMKGWAWWPRKLQQQLVFIVSMLLVVALGLLGGYTAHEQTRIERRAVEQQAAALARHVGVGSVNLILTESLDGLEELVRGSADFEDVRALQVFSADGRNLTHVMRSAGQAPRVVYDEPDDVQVLPKGLEPVLEFDPLWQHIVAWYPIRSDKLIAWVRVDYDMSSLDELKHRIWRNTMVVAVLAVCLCGLLMMVYLRRPMRALNRARRFAVELVDDQGRQMQVENGPIEVVELSGALNEASTLLHQQKLLLEHNLEQIQAHEALLGTQNEQLGAIFALSRDGLLTLDAQGKVQFANQAFMALSGLAPEQVLGSTLAHLDELLRVQMSAPDMFKGLDSCFESAQTVSLVGPPQRVLSLSGQDSDGEHVRRVLYVCDVTKQHTLDQMKSEFLSMAAHELRTPMVSIFGFTELMLKREMSAEQRQDLLGRIHRHSQSMVAILNELLDLARIEARRGQDFKMVPADLAEVVHEVVRDFKPPEGRASPLVSPPPGPLSVHIDTHKLQQAMLNVLSNAYKYSPDGGDVCIRFVIADAVLGRQRVGVVITDQGMGLSPENLARMGERFFRADKSGNIPGTGLGVSIVKELMELMGGRVEIDSVLGEGTTVTLWL